MGILVDKKTKAGKLLDQKFPSQRGIITKIGAAK
jgi:hypothetical protein